MAEIMGMDPATDGDVSAITVIVQPTEREVKLKDKVAAMCEQANAAQVTDLESAERAADLAKWFRVIFKNFEEERKILVKPLNDHVKMINGRFSATTSRIEAGQKVIDQKILTWKSQEERKRKAEEEAKRREQEELALKQAQELEAAGKKEEANAVIENAAAAPAIVPQVGAMRGSYGAVASVRKVWTFEVTDITKVPAEYLEVKTPIVNQAIRAGVRDIPGLRIFEKDSLGVR